MARDIQDCVMDLRHKYLFTAGIVFKRALQNNCKLLDS